MFIDDDCMYCKHCPDIKKFDHPISVLVSVKEVIYCVLCARRLKSKGDEPRCVKECNFRLRASDDEAVTARLLEYAKSGRVANCYACGSKTKCDDDSKFVMCSKDDCNSCRLPMTMRTADDVYIVKQDIGMLVYNLSVLNLYMCNLYMCLIFKFVHVL